ALDDAPRVSARGNEARVQTRQMHSGRGRLPPVGALLVRVRGPGSVAFGDRVSVAGTLRLPANLPGFDRRAYLAARHAYLELVAGQVFVIAEGAGPGRLAGWLRRVYGDS